MNCKEITIRTTGSPELGNLSFFEAEQDVSFPIKRVYYISDVPVGVERGHHAHKSLYQLLFCPYGEILISLEDGESKKEVLLDKPNKGLIIGPGCWRNMTWKKEGAVLCVAASEHYNEMDYIRDYDDFLSYISKKKDNEQ